MSAVAARRFAVFTLVAALCAAGGAADAGARAKLLRLGCDRPGAAREFERWGDERLYVPVPNGGLERGSEGWRLSGGARVVAGNEPFGLGGGGLYSLAIPAGGSATTPAACVKILESNARFLFAQSAGAGGTLRVELQ